MLIQETPNGLRVIDTVIYQIQKNSKVTLTDEVGDFQAGGTSYTWGGQDPAVANPHFKNEPINKKGEPLANTALHCATRVVDVNPNTNRTSIIYTLKGGVATVEYPYAVQVPNDGMADYLITILFIV